MSKSVYISQGTYSYDGPIKNMRDGIIRNRTINSDVLQAVGGPLYWIALILITKESCRELVNEYCNELRTKPIVKPKATIEMSYTYCIVKYFGKTQEATSYRVRSIIESSLSDKWWGHRWYQRKLRDYFFDFKDYEIADWQKEAGLYE